MYLLFHFSYLSLSYSLFRVRKSSLRCFFSRPSLSSLFSSSPSLAVDYRHCHQNIFLFFSSGSHYIGCVRERDDWNDGNTHRLKASSRYVTIAVMLSMGAECSAYISALISRIASRNFRNGRQDILGFSYYFLYFTLVRWFCIQFFFHSCDKYVVLFICFLFILFKKYGVLLLMLYFLLSQFIM